MSSESIHDAARNGELAQVAALLATDPSLANQDDQHQWRPIFHAALSKHLNIVKVLIDYGADLSAHDGYVMHYAGEMPGNKPIVELLVTYGALDAHARPQSDLARQFICAVFLANADGVTAMLRQVPSLAIERYARGDTALHHACRNGDTAIVAALLEHGADVNALNEGGHFPLYCAAGHCHLETTECLLVHGADRSQTFEDGKTLADWLKQYSDHNAGLKRCLELVEQA